MTDSFRCSLDISQSQRIETELASASTRFSLLSFSSNVLCNQLKFVSQLVEKGMSPIQKLELIASLKLLPLLASAETVSTQRVSAKLIHGYSF